MMYSGLTLPKLARPFASYRVNADTSSLSAASQRLTQPREYELDIAQAF